MSVVSELEVVLSGDTSDLKTKLNNADGEVSGFASRVAGKVGSTALAIGKIGLGAAAAIGVAAIAAATEFESAFAEVRKTVEATDEQFELLRTTIRDMSTSTDNPLSSLEGAHEMLAGIMAQGGQLGIATENLESFTETVGAMTVATNLGAEEAGSFFARFANVTGLDATQYRDVGNAIVELGNNMATTESEIATFAQRLAPLATYGFDADEILGYGAAMSSLGVQAEEGSSSFFKSVAMMTEGINKAGELELWAEAAGMAAEEFKALQEAEPSEAFNAFLQGLGQMDAATQLGSLEDLGITSVRQTSTLQRLAAGFETVEDALGLSGDAFEDSNALMEEAEKKADTAAGNIESFKNNIHDLGVELGDTLLPHFTVFISGLTRIAQGDLGGGLADMGDGIAGLLGDITGWDFSSVDEGIAAWVGAFETAGQTIAIVMDNVKRGVEKILLDIGIALGQAAIDMANNPLIQLSPQAGMINQMVAPAEAGLAAAQGQRANMDVADTFTEDLVAAKKGADIDLAGILMPEDTSGVAAAMSERGRIVIEDMMSRLTEEQDWENLGLMIPMAEALDFDTEGLTEMINLKLDEAIMMGDEEAFNALIPTAAELDIPLDMLQMQMDESIADAAAAQDYEAEATVLLSIDVDVVNMDAVKSAVSGAMKAAGAGVTGVSNPNPAVHHTGGTFYHPSGEGLAFLKSGETIRTEAQEQALRRSRGNGARGGGDTYIVNSYGQSAYGLVTEVERAQRDMG